MAGRYLHFTRKYYTILFAVQSCTHHRAVPIRVRCSWLAKTWRRTLGRRYAHKERGWFAPDMLRHDTKLCTSRENSTKTSVYGRTAPESVMAVLALDPIMLSVTTPRTSASKSRAGTGLAGYAALYECFLPLYFIWLLLLCVNTANVGWLTFIQAYCLCQVCEVTATISHMNTRHLLPARRCGLSMSWSLRRPAQNCARWQ